MLKSLMTDDIRTTVRVEMLRGKRKQSEIAERIGVSRQHLSNVLNGRTANLPKVWEDLLDELGLEIVVQPKREA